MLWLISRLVTEIQPVHSLNRLKGDPYSWLEQIVAAKRGARRVLLTRASNQIKGRYADFLVHFDPGKLGLFASVTLAADLEEALLHCYSNSTAPLKSLRVALTAAQDLNRQNFCPYCHISTHSTLDHYLPKEQFPELCVHPDNLIPACNVCNGLKSTKWKLPGGQRRFLHFYLDAIPTGPFLRCNLRWVVAKGERVPNTTWELTPKATTLIGQHFKDLDLLNRYKDHAHDVFVETRNALSLLRGHKIDEARSAIWNYLQSIIALRGRSNWRAVLIRRLALDTRFLHDALV